MGGRPGVLIFNWAPGAQLLFLHMGDTILTEYGPKWGVS